MRFEKITCDGCGADLTTCSNSVDYRLVLYSEEKPGYGDGFYTCMMIYPPVDRQYHFCGLHCLDRWRDRERLFAKLRKERSDQWAEERGTKIDGRIISYPRPPTEVLKEWESECRAAADQAFPLGRRS
jgi:hypothetical protein